jgi:hypothetical protein
VVAAPAGSVEYVETPGHCTTAVEEIVRHLDARRSKFVSLDSEWPVVPGVRASCLRWTRAYINSAPFY